MNGFEKLLSTWEKTFYTEPFYIMCEIISLVIGFVFVRKYKIGIVFISYIAFDFFIAIIDEYLKFFSNCSKSETNQLLYLFNSVICLVEFSAYSFFFYHTFNRIKTKRIVTIVFPIFLTIALLLVIAQLTQDFDTRRFANFIGGVEFVILLFLCLIYYMELFQAPLTDLSKKPSFSITTGIFIYSVVSIPHYFISDLITKNIGLKNSDLYRFYFYSIYYIPFGINFLFLTKAFLCKKQLSI